MKPGRSGRARRPLAAIVACTGIAACTGSVGPYIRSIEVTPDGAVIVERCTTLTTDYGVVATFDNESSWCDKNVLPLQPIAGGPAAGPGGPAAPPFPAAAGPTMAPPPPLPPATPAGVMTPGGAAPPSMAQPGAPGPGRPAVAPGPCSEGMALMPAGQFAMGDRKDRVKVGRLCMDVIEVTAEAYSTCVRIGQCTAEGLSCGPAATFGVQGKGSHPINCVDWNQASNYCQVQGKRLPTEEEFEWAARGGAQAKMYPWGNIEPSSQACWSGAGQLSGTCQAGAYLAGANPQGILDLSGNVWEWTSSKKDAGSTERVARGGAWSSSASSYLRASERYWTSPLYRFIYIGFRCVKSV